jgi:hypothetical protein
MPPSVESARQKIWDRLDEDGRIHTRPTSIGQLLGKVKLEKPLADIYIYLFDLAYRPSAMMAM